MNNDIHSPKEQAFRSYLRTIGMKGTGERGRVFRVFLGTNKPVSVLDLLYLTKAEAIDASYHMVARTLKLIVASGFASELVEPGSATRYQHGLAKCNHEHLACKDCGAAISPEGGQHGAVEQQR
jgi:Fe2+ or Zn2+ uptake regulation protein